MHNQNPVLIAHDAIYKLLIACECTILNQNVFHLATGTQLLLLNNDSLPFVYVLTGEISCFTYWLGNCIISGISQLEKLMLRRRTTNPIRVYMGRFISPIDKLCVIINKTVKNKN